MSIDFNNAVINAVFSAGEHFNKASAYAIEYNKLKDMGKDFHELHYLETVFESYRIAKKEIRRAMIGGFRENEALKSLYSKCLNELLEYKEKLKAYKKTNQKSDSFKLFDNIENLDF